ncbi:helix-turn-helix domain-containing protein [Flexithrix dorotheae]|uniref:helix-turn-helix domain-containing protein n=1 Tax=Flexithrix dorotheae TaxID=70993 RepID=UPI000A042351|nr:helix-turn-helix domain-containing protein [Flexithrix dorotheae]
MERKRHKVRDRMHAIFLLYRGYSRTHCAGILNLSYHTINNYIYLYQQGGLTRLRQTSCYRP